MFPKNAMYVPSGQGYGGYTDRHALIPSGLLRLALNITSDLVLHWQYWYDLVDTHLKTQPGQQMNLEQLLKYYYDKVGVKVVTVGHTGFTVKLATDPTRWSSGEVNHKVANKHTLHFNNTLAFIFAGTREFFPGVSQSPVVTAYLDHAQIASPPAIQASAQLSAEVSASLATLSELVLSSDPPYKCLHKVRVGTQADGGWFICADIKPKRDCVVYSVGIANDYSFDVEFGRRYGCKVYSFDPTISHPHKLSRDADVRFFQFGMAGVNNFGRGMPVVTIPYAMKLLGHRRIDVLKIDCEGCELSVLENMRKAAPQVLDHVEQVLVEFHLSTTLGMNSTESILLLATIFRWLSDRGFLLFHKSLNNGFLQDQHVYPDLLLSGFPPRTCCVELCFVSRRAVHRAQAGGALVSSVSPSADEGNYFGRDDWSKPLFKGLRLTEQAAGAIVDLGLQPGAAACRAACAQYELNRCRSFQWGADYPAVVSSDHQMKCLGRTDDTWAPVQANGYVSGIIPENFRTMWFYQETGLYSRRDEVQTDLVGYAHSTDIFWLQNRTQDAPITVEPSRKQPVAAYLIILSQQDLEMLLSTLQSMDAYLMGRMRTYPILIYTTQAWPSELYQAVKVAAGDLASQMRVTSLEETGNKPAVLFSKVVQMQAEAGMEYFMHLKPGSVFTSELGSTSDLFHWMEDHQCVKRILH
ncbi:hypothetical protein CYMTET_24884 [Cymbomonas tetramitiformis]|uniref:Methyltransferase domain-containing protein n=1 Tax=Cymbomonas tetramitiformis TaxID=36881 RepID=A0AAE0KZR3_9CHLO|nr:hypothetical protein CYMTET_24884 [Cymbomonas tetramitiformis]